MNKYFLFLIVSIFFCGCSANSDLNSPANASASNIENAPGVPNAVNAPGVPSSGRPVLQFEPAPEDSQIAQATTSSGQLYEVRIWKKHPRLLKVESTTFEQNNKALTIILRSTQITNVTTDRIPNIKLATANQFLELVGVQPGAATPPNKTAGNAPRRFHPEMQQAE